MCELCEKNPVYEFTNKRKVCARCFIRYFQKKFMYTIKKFSMIEKGDVIGYKKSDDLKSVVLIDSLTDFEKKAPVEVVNLPSKKANKIALPDSIDSESDKIIHSLIEAKESDLKKRSPKTKKEIKPLYLFLDKEIKLYADLKNLKYKETKSKEDKFSKFINKMEEKHPEIKRAIINSYLEIYE